MVIGTKQLLKVMVKHDGNHTKTAKELGITQPAVTKRVNKNPEIKKAILNVREAALKKAGLSRDYIYRGIKKGCQATVIYEKNGKLKKSNIADHAERKHYLKLGLLLHKDLDPDKEFAINNIAQIIFNVLTQPNRKEVLVYEEPQG